MGNSPYTTLILIVVMVVAFYLLILRPQRKRQQAQAQTINALTPGTRVVTGSGIYGTLIEVADKQAVMEISPGARLTVLKQAIVRVVPAGEEDADVPEVGPTYDQTDDVAFGETGTADEGYAPEPSHDFRRSADATTETPGFDPERPRGNS
ncbi:MAG: preprotein translocase subunit YajC [Propionibacteriaceae bacterium]